MDALFFSKRNSLGKNNFFSNANADADGNTDADLMQRFSRWP